MTHYEFFKRFYARFNKRNTFRKGTSEKAICPSIKFIKNTALCYLFKLNWIYLDDQIALPSPIVNKLPSNYTTFLHNKFPFLDCERSYPVKRKVGDAISIPLCWKNGCFLWGIVTN